MRLYDQMRGTEDGRLMFSLSVSLGVMIEGRGEVPRPRKPQAGRFGQARTSVDHCSDRNEHRTPSKLPHPIVTTIALAFACFTRIWLVYGVARRHSGSEAEVPDAYTVAEDEVDTMTGSRLRNSGSFSNEYVRCGKVFRCERFSRGSPFKALALYKPSENTIRAGLT